MQMTVFVRLSSCLVFLCAVAPEQLATTLRVVVMGRRSGEGDFGCSVVSVLVRVPVNRACCHSFVAVLVQAMCVCDTLECMNV